MGREASPTVPVWGEDRHRRIAGGTDRGVLELIFFPEPARHIHRVPPLHRQSNAPLDLLGAGAFVFHDRGSQRGLGHAVYGGDLDRIQRWPQDSLRGGSRTMD